MNTTTLSKTDIFKIEKEYRWLVRYRWILSAVCIPCMFLGKYMPVKYVPLHPPILLSSIIAFSLILTGLLFLSTKKMNRMKNDLQEGIKNIITSKKFKASNNYDGTFSLEIQDEVISKYDITKEDYNKIKDCSTISIEITPKSNIFLTVYPVS